MLGNILPPQVAMNLIRSQLESQLKKEINTFDIVFRNDKNKLYFVVDDLSYEFDQPVLKNLVHEQTKDVVEKGCTITLVKIHCEKDSDILCFVYYIDSQNKKRSLSKKL